MFLGLGTASIRSCIIFKSASNSADSFTSLSYVFNGAGLTMPFAKGLDGLRRGILGEVRRERLEPSGEEANCSCNCFDPASNSRYSLKLLSGFIEEVTIFCTTASSVFLLFGDTAWKVEEEFE